MHDLCAVLVCRNDRSRLDAALLSLLEHASGLALDVVVVDVGNDGSADQVEERFLDVRVIRCPGQSPGYAKNRALETASARYVLFLEANMEILDGSLGALMSALDYRPDVALAAGRQFHGDGSPAPGIRRFPCEWTSGFMLVRGAALDNVGWFDERFSLRSDEIDLCWRLKRARWEIIETPRVTIRCHDRQTTESARLEAEAAYARVQFARKHFPRVAAEYRWALALRYALRLGRYSLSRRYGSDRRRAARAALAAVLRGRPPLDEQSAL